VSKFKEYHKHRKHSRVDKIWILMTEIIIKTSAPARVPPTPPLPLINLSPLAPHEPAAKHKRHTKHPPEQTCHPTLPRRALTGLDLLPHRVDAFGELVLRGRWRGRWWRYCRRGHFTLPLRCCNLSTLNGPPISADYTLHFYSNISTEQKVERVDIASYLAMVCRIQGCQLYLALPAPVQRILEL
jgi:hypothetical protein